MGVAQFHIGILGGGQLARMTVMAAQRMGLKVLSLDPDSSSPAAQVGPAQQGSITDPEAIAKIMAISDRVTFENEFIPAEALRKACQIANFPEANIIPGIDTLEAIQDKYTQRLRYVVQDVPSPRAVEAADAPELGFPCMLKSKFGGYDGKGTLPVKTEEEWNSSRSFWENGGWLAEEFVTFRRELAVMVVSTPSGKTFCFPTMVTEQTNQVCDLVYPCENPEVCARAEAVAIQAVKAVGGIGLFGVELFELPDGNVSVNEIAPRPHNTGHYTMDWGGTSQFEAHALVVLDAITSVQVGQKTCMANLLGQPNAKDIWRAILQTTRAYPDARIHWYGKAESKPGRKMGHLNVVGHDDVRERARVARETLYQAWTENEN